MPRKPNNTPATAYQYRRCIELVQVLAIVSPAAKMAGLKALAQAWGVEWDSLSVAATIYKLARHALKGPAGD